MLAQRASGTARHSQERCACRLVPGAQPRSLRCSSRSFSSASWAAVSISAPNFSSSILFGGTPTVSAASATRFHSARISWASLPRLPSVLLTWLAHGWLSSRFVQMPYCSARAKARGTYPVPNNCTRLRIPENGSAPQPYNPGVHPAPNVRYPAGVLDASDA